MSKAIVHKKTGKIITDADIDSTHPERIKELLIKSGKYVWEGEKIEVTAEQGATIVEQEIIRLTKDREEFEVEKAAFEKEKTEFFAFKGESVKELAVEGLTDENESQNPAAAKKTTVKAKK